MGDISKNFSVSEFIYSDTAKQKGIDNAPSAKEIENIKKLVINVVQPARDWLGSPIYINSGYRCKKLNTAVKGSKTSDHMTGCAVDITTRDKAKNEALFIWLKHNVKYKQLIWENNGQWIHISYVEGDNKGQVLNLIQE